MRTNTTDTIQYKGKDYPYRVVRVKDKKQDFDKLEKKIRIVDFYIFPKIRICCFTGPFSFFEIWWSRRVLIPRPEKCASAFIPVETFHGPVFFDHQ